MRKKGLYAFAQFVVPPIFKLIYRYQIIGKENIPTEGGVFLCSNHTSYKDPIFLGVVQKRQVWFMAKKELFKNRFFSFIISSLGAFPVERAGGVNAIRRGIDIINQDGVVGIFIEGTRSKTGEFLNPKPGVVLLVSETNAPVVPVDIIGADGKPPRAFHKTIIRVGKLIQPSELGLEELSGTAMRQASRLIMSKIKSLREETLAKTNKAKG